MFILMKQNGKVGRAKIFESKFVCSEGQNILCDSGGFLVSKKLFSGQELGVVDTLPNIIKRTLITMNINDDKDQDEIIKHLIKIGEEKGEKRKEKVKEKEKDGSVDDVWK